MEDEDRASWAEPLLGERLRSLRQLRDWSQEDVANRMRSAGFTWRQSTVAKTEAADRPIRVNEAAALAEIFGSDLGELLKPDQHPLLVRLRQGMSVLGDVERRAYDAEQAHAEAVDLMRFTQRRVAALEALAGYVTDRPNADPREGIAKVVESYHTKDEWKVLLLEAGFDRDAVEQAHAELKRLVGPDPAYGRLPSEDWFQRDGRLIAEFLVHASGEEGGGDGEHQEAP